MRYSTKRLSDVAFINPRRPSLERNDDTYTSFIPMEDVDDINGIVNKLIRRPYAEVKSGYTYFEENDVIFAKITPCMQNGKHAVVRGLADGIGFGSTEFHVIRSSEEVIPEWIHFFLRRKETLNAAERTFTGAVGQQRVPKSFLENLEIPIPSISEQRRIAVRLKAQLTEVEKARKAAETQLYDVFLLESRTLDAIFSELETTSRKKIGDVAQTTSGSTPARSQKLYWEPADIPWVKTAEVAFAPITSTEERVSRIALKECSLTLLPPKTVLVAMYGQGKTRGQSAILEMAATTNQACFAILPNETWEPKFLYYWLKHSYLKLRALSEDRGGNQANLNGALLKAFEVPTPQKSVQKKIVEKVALALKEINLVYIACNSALVDIQRIPNSLLSQAFEKN